MMDQSNENRSIIRKESFAKMKIDKTQKNYYWFTFKEKTGLPLIEMTGSISSQSIRMDQCEWNDGAHIII